MADDVDETGPFYKGSVLPVTIESVLPDVLVVCLKHGAKIYRGVLMDSVKRDLPHGLNFSVNKLKKGYESQKTENTGSCAELNVASNPPEISALVNRHTYNLDSNNVGPKLLSPPRVDISRPLRDKKIRNMRLRPRQVLCSKCKEGVHDTKIPTNQKVTKETESTQATQPNPPPPPPPKPVPVETHKYDTRKRKQLASADEDKVVPSLVVGKSKSRRLCNTKDVSKSSPVIKISFTGPKGLGTVVEIPRKPNIPQPSDSDEVEGKHSPSMDVLSSRTPHEEQRRLRKAQRKAEKKSKERGTDVDSVTSSENVVPTSSVPIAHERRKKSKRTKHKRKHRHRNTKKQSINCGQSEGNESMKENDNEAKSVSLDNIDKEDEVDGMLMYADDDDDDESDSMSLSRYLDVDTEERDPGDGIVVLSPRHNFMLENNMKLGTPNKQSDSNTETSQDLDLDFKDFFGTKASLNGSDTENNLSDTQFEVNGDYSENLDEGFNGEFASSEAAVDDGRGTQAVRPLMIRIQNRFVSKVLLDDGRAIRKGDVIWGKIHGFPWWPGRVVSISESLKDCGIIINQTAQISWFASSTMSHMACGDLYPFLQDFKLRYNKKKKGTYKVAVKQATIVAQGVASELQSMTPEFPEVDIEVIDQE